MKHIKRIKESSVLQGASITCIMYNLHNSSQVFSDQHNRLILRTEDLYQYLPFYSLYIVRLAYSCVFHVRMSTMTIPSHERIHVVFNFIMNLFIQSTA